jgi:YggT family protein
MKWYIYESEEIYISLIEEILTLLFDFMQFMIFVDVVLSLVFMGKENKLTYYVRIITDPILSPFQKLQRKIVPNSPLDFSPILAIVALSIIQTIVFAII